MVVAPGRPVPTCTSVPNSRRSGSGLAEAPFAGWTGYPDSVGALKNGDMADIIEFLEARIAEDEAAAADLAAREAAAAEQKTELEAGGSGHPAVQTRLEVPQFTAARVLAECAAKRKILANVPLVTDIPSQMGGTSEYVLMCLASVYSWHPEYQEGWTVTG